MHSNGQTNLQDDSAQLPGLHTVLLTVLWEWPTLQTEHSEPHLFPQCNVLMLVSTPHRETLCYPHPANYTLAESEMPKKGKTGYIQIKIRNDNKCVVSPQLKLWPLTVGKLVTYTRNWETLWPRNIQAQGKARMTCGQKKSFLTHSRGDGRNEHYSSLLYP